MRQIPHLQESGEPPFWKHLGFRVVSFERGAATIEVEIVEHHLRTLGFMHGGVLMAMCDSALGMAAWSAAPDGSTPVTIQISVNFVKAVAKGDRLTTSATMQHLGRHTAVGRAEARTSAGVLAGTASATFMYVQADFDAGPIVLSPPTPE